MLKPIKSVPRSNYNKESYVAKDVREFLRSGMDAAEVVIEGRKTTQVTAALNNYIKSHPDQCKGIRASQRSGKVYLYRIG